MTDNAPSISRLFPDEAASSTSPAAGAYFEYTPFFESDGPIAVHRLHRHFLPESVISTPIHRADKLTLSDQPPSEYRRCLDLAGEPQLKRRRLSTSAFVQHVNTFLPKIEPAEPGISDFDFSLGAIQAKGKVVEKEDLKMLSLKLKDPSCRTTLLDLSSNFIKDEGIETVVDVLRYPSNQILILDLGRNTLGPTSATLLAEALKHEHSKVAILNLEQNLIRQGIWELANTIKSPWCHLTNINLAGNDVGVEGAIVMAESLKAPCCNISAINLGSNNIGYEGALAIAMAMRDPNCKLTAVNLERNQIRDARAMAETLRNVHCKLSDLCLAENGIPDSVTKAMSESLRESVCPLTSLDLQENRMSDESTIDLAKTIVHENCKLFVLRLRGNAIGDNGKAALHRALRDPACRIRDITFGKRRPYLGIASSSSEEYDRAAEISLRSAIELRYRSVRFLHFCLGRHSRTGAASPVGMLVDDVIGVICGYLFRIPNPPSMELIRKLLEESGA